MPPGDWIQYVMNPTRLRHRMGQTKDFRKIQFGYRSYNHTFDLTQPDQFYAATNDIIIIRLQHSFSGLIDIIFVRSFQHVSKYTSKPAKHHDFILDKVSYDSIINRTAASEPPTLAPCYQWCFDWEPFEGAASE